MPDGVFSPFWDLPRGGPKSGPRTPFFGISSLKSVLEHAMTQAFQAPGTRLKVLVVETQAIPIRKEHTLHSFSSFFRNVLAIAELKSSFVDLLGSAARNAVLAIKLRGKFNFLGLSHRLKSRRRRERDYVSRVHLISYPTNSILGLFLYLDQPVTELMH